MLEGTLKRVPLQLIRRNRPSMSITEKFLAENDSKDAVGIANIFTLGEDHLDSVKAVTRPRVRKLE